MSFRPHPYNSFVLKIHSAQHSIIYIFLFVLQMKETIMNQEKLAKLQAQVRIGGKVREC